MTNKDVLIIVVVSTWLIGVLITGLLALIFKDKFKNFKEQNILIQSQLKQESSNFKLKEVEINFKLPKEEKCFFYEKNINLFKVKLNNKKAKQNYKKELKESKLNCSIYVTNKRIMIQLNDQYFQYYIKNTLYCNYLLVYFKRNWLNSIQLEINEDKYIILSQNFNLLLTVKELNKKEK
ncbi:hypothetical protein [Spiroplasma floricola]|uniref:Transmembrane protein n=1 Tax=Spiroplasma floricola 23-6 TaxID=1336749 RepID=A0A2K8SE28_9MOLU|nr:hypothetical protein [Spiroplasma floricola]AUB31595.1 hypothetical protein SFLOR_v1c05430 [Spiroplasma floricola 23-6]